MNIHEYQAKELFASYGLPTAPGIAVRTGPEALAAAETLGGTLWVVKAQVHAGSRGKAGGVKLAHSPQQARELAAEMLSHRLYTHQSGPEGVPVDRVYIVRGVDIEQEYYLALVTDAAHAGLMLIASARGGMDIEQVAAEYPQELLRQPIDLALGIRPYLCRTVADRLGISPALRESFAAILRAMYRLFVEHDCSMVEVNPLAETPEGFIAVDAKISFDDNAAFRHPEHAILRDRSQEDPREVEASRFGLSYVGLGGDIGCMVNGAGLAMATMDMLHHYGGSPANFLDVGGGNTEENITGAFRILLSDPKVKAILVNIFGGIMRCDVIAAGIIGAARQTGPGVPLIVRLEGNHADEGRRLLAESGLAVTTAATLEDAVQAAVGAAGEEAAS